MDPYIGSSFALLCDEEGEVDMSKLTAKAESLEAKKRRMEILQASRERKAQFGYSFYVNEGEPEDRVEEERSSSSQVTKSELQKPEKNTKKEKKTKKKDGEIIKEKKNQKVNLIKDYRKPVVEQQRKKTHRYFEPRTWKKIKKTISVISVVAILLAVLPERKDIVFH